MDAPPTRKRPRQARAKDTVATILAAAARVLVEDGYAKATTNRVARVAGVSIGSLYQYFPNKDALVAALVERHVRDIMTMLTHGLMAAAAKPLDQAVRQLVGAMLEAHRLEPELHRVFAEQLPRVATPDDHRRVNTTAQSMIHAYLQERRSEIRPDVDIGIASFLLVHAVEAATHAAVIEQPAMSEEPRLLDEITSMIVRYLAG